MDTPFFIGKDFGTCLQTTCGRFQNTIYIQKYEETVLLINSHRGRQVERIFMNIINKKIELSDGRVIEIETGKLAKQADGSVVVKMGGTMLLSCVT